MTEFTVQLRNELQDDYRVFYVTAWGYAADHLFGWFPKALNCHHDVSALLAHEGSRPKYIAERTRGERPSLIPFTEFLNDMGMTYSAIGDCYSYRASQMPELLTIERYKNIPVVNLLRHPVVWLEYYVRWRASNMRMREGATDPLAWEWKAACHGYFEYLGLPEYSKNDIDVWASYQGMFQLNNVLGDINAVKQHIAIEKISDEPETFRNLTNYLTRGEVEFDDYTLDLAYSIRDELFRGESEIETNPELLVESWPGWKVDAFRKLVSSDALDAYKAHDYDLAGLTQRGFRVQPVPGKLDRSLFVSTLPKSGTWLLREILESVTELKANEPEMGSGAPDYEDEMLIDFPFSTFFSWHSVITPRTASLLISSQTKNIFLIRNIYDVLISMFHHLSHDVDSAIGRSVIGKEYFEGKSIEQCMTLMINGFTSPEMTWLGAGPIIKQMESMLAFAESGQALLLSYERLVHDKCKTIRRIIDLLGIKISSKRIREIIESTEKDQMRSRLEEEGSSAHVTKQEHALGREVFSQYHKEMIDRIVMSEGPMLPDRLRAMGMDYILHLEEEFGPEKNRTIAHELSSWLCSNGINIAWPDKK